MDSAGGWESCLKSHGSTKTVSDWVTPTQPSACENTRKVAVLKGLCFGDRLAPALY